MPLSDRAGMLGVLLEESPLGIICLDSNGNVQVWSRAAEAMLGWREDEVMGRPVPVELQLPYDRAEPAELRLRKRDGGIIDVEVRMAPWRDSQGGQGVLCIVADISPRRDAKRD